LASTSKRLDLCAAQIAHALHLSGFFDELPLRGKVCLELGTGWVLSHAVILHLLGAKRVMAADIQRIAYPSNLYQSIHGSVISIIRDILSPFEEHSIIRDRLNKLLAIRTFTFHVLKELGIEYVAPIDLSSCRLNREVDFVFSHSVLEHVPANHILPLLQNITSDLSNGGIMIHLVHLEDHRDSQNAPFGFLGEPEEKFTEEVQGNRGNRIRRSQWRNILFQVRDMDFKFIYEWSRRDGELPKVVDRSINYIDDEDLRVCNIGILGTKEKRHKYFV
jgi:hypothetical protein